MSMPMPGTATQAKINAATSASILRATLLKVVPVLVLALAFAITLVPVRLLLPDEVACP